MPTRDRKACNKAIAEAWKREQQLVLEGKGTRNWTEEQQLDIIELGKAFDNDGIAFEGQHMKSALAYPDYQGDPNNIQLLSKSEHLAAHKGDFRNPTNWYYDPVSNAFWDFGESAPTPCKIIDLEVPIAIKKSDFPGKESQIPSPKSTLDSANSGQSSSPLTEHDEGEASAVDSDDTLKGWIKQRWEYAKLHPVKTFFKIVGWGATAYASYKAGKAIKSHIFPKNAPVPKVVNKTSSQHVKKATDLAKTLTNQKVNQIIQQKNVMPDLVKPVIETTKSIPGLKDYSVLLMNGYSTALPQEARHKILESVLSKSGKQPIIRLLRFLISTRSANKLNKYEKAIAIWQDDLDFISRL